MKKISMKNTWKLRRILKRVMDILKNYKINLYIKNRMHVEIFQIVEQSKQ